MRNKLGIISDAAKLTVAFHTKRTQRALHKTGIKDIMARQGLSWNDSSHGSGVAFTERQSDTKRTSSPSRYRSIIPSICPDR